MAASNPPTNSINCNPEYIMKIENPVRLPITWFTVVAAGVLAIAPLARADYQSTVLADNPLAFYPLNLEVDTGGTATDVSGNGNDGAYVNIFSGFNNSTGPSAYITNAVSFDGFDTSVDLSGASSLTSLAGAVTLEAWVQPADSTSFGDIIAKGYDSSTYQESYIRVDGPYGAIYDVNLGNAQITGGQQAASWTHVVLANNGTTTSLYINGVLIQSKSDSVGGLSFSDPWAIGNGTSAGNGRHFNGNISQVALYSHALTASQVLNHYIAAYLGVPANNAIPFITAQPQSLPSYVGGTVTFSLAAVSVLSITNEWFKDGSPLTGKTNSTLVLSNLQPSDAGSYSVVAGNANGTTNSSAAVLTVATPRNLEWSANANSGNWDNTSANWINLANSQQTAFNPGDAVLFDDTPGVPTAVTVSDTVVPSAVDITASANNYTLNGPSRLSGSGSLIKDGTSTLSIFTPGGFAGTVAIKAGTVYAGNNCFSAVSSIAITNNATLDLGGGQFNSSTPISVAGTGSSGQGALVNTYADYPNESVNITMTGDTKFGGSARWDMGNGAQLSGAHNLTLDWSASGNYAEWNAVTIGANVLGVATTNGSTLGINGMDTSCQNPSTLFTIAANAKLVLYSGGFNGSVNLLNGSQMIVYSGNVALGGSSLHLSSGSILYVYSANDAISGGSLVMEDGSSLQTYYNGGDNPVSSAVTLNGMAHFVLGDHTESFNNVISGTGGFVLDYYNNAMVLSASNTYSGPTSIGGDGNSVKVSLVGNGSISHSSQIFFQGSDSTVTHLDVTGRSDQTLTVASGQTLAGVGAINGSLVISSGATVSPSGTNSVNGSTSANTVGAIAASGNVALGGTTVIKLNGSGTNDSVRAGGNLSYGGTLSLANLGGAPLAAGNTFRIFTAGGSISSSFTRTNLATLGAGLAWNTSQLSSGVLSVVATSGPLFTSVMQSGTNIFLSGSGGSANGTFYVLAATNLLTSNWVVWSTNNYDSSGNFSLTNPITDGTPECFYRIQQ